MHSGCQVLDVDEDMRGDVSHEYEEYATYARSEQLRDVTVIGAMLRYAASCRRYRNE